MDADHCRTGGSGARSGGSPVADQLSIEGHDAAGGSLYAVRLALGCADGRFLDCGHGYSSSTRHLFFSLRTFGKYSYALYFVHGHANRLSAKLGFDPNHGIITGGTVLPCQILYIFVAPGASLVVRLPKVAFI